MDELKPCPFCGGKVFMFRDLESETYMTRCRKCSALFKQYYAVKDEAVEGWNERAERSEGK